MVVVVVVVVVGSSSSSSSSSNDLCEEFTRLAETRLAQSSLNYLKKLINLV